MECRFARHCSSCSTLRLTVSAHQGQTNRGCRNGLKAIARTTANVKLPTAKMTEASICRAMRSSITIVRRCRGAAAPIKVSKTSKKRLLPDVFLLLFNLLHYPADPDRVMILDTPTDWSSATTLRGRKVRLRDVDQASGNR